MRAWLLAVAGLAAGLCFEESQAAEYFRMRCNGAVCGVTGVDSVTGAERAVTTIDRTAVGYLTPGGVQYDAVNDRLIVSFSTSAGREVLTVNPQDGSLVASVFESAQGLPSYPGGPDFPASPDTYASGTPVPAGGGVDPMLSPRVSTLETAVSALDGRVTGLEGRMTGAENRLDGVEGRLDLQEQKLQELADEIETVAAMAAAIDIQRPLPGKTFRVGVSGGAYQSTTAVGLSLSGQAGPWDVGVGGSTANGQVMGKAAAGFSW